MAGENQGPLVAIAVFQASWAMTAKAPRNRRVATMRRWRGMGNPFVNRCPVWRYKRPSSVIARDNHPGLRDCGIPADAAFYIGPEGDPTTVGGGGAGGNQQRGPPSSPTRIDAQVSGA